MKRLLPQTNRKKNSSLRMDQSSQWFNFCLETSRTPTAMDGARASSISGYATVQESASGHALRLRGEIANSMGWFLAAETDPRWVLANRETAAAVVQEQIKSSSG